MAQLPPGFRAELQILNVSSKKIQNLQCLIVQHRTDSKGIQNRGVAGRQQGLCIAIAGAMGSFPPASGLMAY